jgi:hypothetical protein
MDTLPLGERADRGGILQRPPAGRPERRVAGHDAAINLMAPNITQALKAVVTEAC